VEFIVSIEVKWPPDGDAATRERLVEAEARRAAELVSSGNLVRIWRIPGRWANVGLWRARDSDELHQCLTSLPFFPWLDIDVQPLATHPSDPEGHS
jgi:muconolactone delta-isomerase